MIERFSSKDRRKKEIKQGNYIRALGPSMNGEKRLLYEKYRVGFLHT
ncbi:MAG TPA: hypothetical protein VFS22_05015 [Flavisolibacter sp.]|nr:hypothetical protein [Flavisolibacter sp.]